MVTFTVPGIPVPQGSKNVFNGRLVDVNDKKLKAWRKSVAVCASNAIKVETPIDEPLRVTMEFRFPHTKGHYGTGKNALVLKENAPYYLKSKPDLDKLVRAVGDALTNSKVIRDDSRIVELSAVKIYGSPGVTITIERAQLQMLKPIAAS